MIPTTRIKYEAIAAQLRGDLAAGYYHIGDRFPAESALQAQFRVALPTVRAALSVLADEGLIDRRQGVGTFVLALPPAALVTPGGQVDVDKAAAAVAAEMLRMLGDNSDAAIALAGMAHTAVLRAFGCTCRNYHDPDADHVDALCPVHPHCPAPDADGQVPQ